MHARPLQTPNAIWERIKAGATGDIMAVMDKWTKIELWYPPKQDQVGAWLQCGL